MVIPAGHDSPDAPPQPTAQPRANMGSDANAATATPSPAAGHGCWKALHALLLLILMVLIVIAVMSGIMATRGCVSSLSTVASTVGSPLPATTTTTNPRPTPLNKTGAPEMANSNATTYSPTGQPTHMPTAAAIPSRAMDPPKTTMDPTMMTPMGHTMAPTENPTNAPMDPTMVPAEDPANAPMDPTMIPTEDHANAPMDPTVATTAPLPTATPILAPRAEQVVTFINSITLTGRTIAMSETNSTYTTEPEELALHWLVYNDYAFFDILPDTPIHRFRLQQRYALATLLVQGDATNASLVTVDAECEWDGVTCQNASLGPESGTQEAVTEIYIATNNEGWTGRLSADLGLLSTLIHCRMSGYFGCVGGLIGTLPKEIGRWSNLESLDVSWNVLSGRLPSQIGQWTNLQSFDVSLNSLIGMLPSQIWQLTNLQILDVGANPLIGSLPSQIVQLTNLQSLSVYDNRLTGSLPSQIWQLTKLTALHVSYNHLVGTLPSQIGQLTNLQSFGASYNALNGTLPSQIGHLTNLETFDVIGNELTGTLPSQIGQCTKLTLLNVNSNDLTGSLPSQIGQLTNLEALYLVQNHFTGTMPNSVCLLRNHYLLYLEADCEVSCNENCCIDCYQRA
jgi:hypothetical protein